MTLPKDPDGGSDDIKAWIGEQQKLNDQNVWSSSWAEPAQYLPRPEYELRYRTPGKSDFYECGWCSALVIDQDKHTLFHHRSSQVLR